MCYRLPEKDEERKYEVEARVDSEQRLVDGRAKVGMFRYQVEQEAVKDEG